MKLTRIVHPIGFGAFYTEQFRNEAGNVVFTAIYDCGSTLKAGNEHIMEFCKSVDCIDALFISHFHADHVSSLKKILETGKVKRLYIPQLTFDLQLESMLYTRAHDTFTDAWAVESVLNALCGGDEHLFEGTDIFEVLQTTADNIRESGVREIPDDRIRASIDVIAARKHYPSDGIEEVPDSDWEYRMLNVVLNPDCAKDLKNAITEKYEDCSFDSVKRFVKELPYEYIKAIYRKYFSGNGYSMTVLSGPVQPNKRWQCDENSRCHRFSLALFHRSGCLYMGDFEKGSGDRNTMALKRYYTQQWDTLGMIQVPHHGSIANHTNLLYENRLPFFCFVSSRQNDSKQLHPPPLTIVGICEQNSFVQVVTERVDSMIMTNYSIK